MSICPNCKAETVDGAKFCGSCGSALEAVSTQFSPAPVYEQTIAPQPTYKRPVSAKEQPKEHSRKATMILGMIFGIIGFLLSLLNAGVTYAVLSEGELIWALIASAALMIFSLPTSIVGRALSCKCSRAGTRNGMVIVGKIFSLIGIILTTLSFAICLLMIINVVAKIQKFNIHI